MEKWIIGDDNGHVIFITPVLHHSNDPESNIPQSHIDFFAIDYPELSKLITPISTFYKSPDHFEKPFELHKALLHKKLLR